MQLLGLLVCSAVIVGLVSAVDDVKPSETVELNPPVGRVRGSLMTSRLGRRIYSFRGVRYAQSPTGDRRFKPPEPVVPWKNVFDATKEGPSCPQLRGVLSSEDCLRLNVYTTALPCATGSGDSGNPKRPVIIYFHPGGFYSASAQSRTVGPRYFMDQDIVLVTVNYRLGTLGFISTGDALAPGNLGLKDQVVAMRWVRKNIATFGGDPNSVTIAGYSAGSRSILLHLLSPMTKGLFHRAITMSGFKLFDKPFPNNQTNVAKKQAELVGCPTNSTAAIIDCLKTKPAQQLGEALPGFFEWHFLPISVWSPVIEPDIPGVERYLTAQPSDLIMQGKIHQVPVIAGVNEYELGGIVVPMIEEARKGNTSTFDELNNDWERIAPIIFAYERGTQRSREISRDLRQFYFKGQPISLRNVDSLAHLFADALVISKAHRFVTLIGRYTTMRIYYYQFTYPGRYSHVVFSDTKKPFGVVHHDELLYLFYNSRFPVFENNDPEIPTVERMTGMWANFAKTGEPIPRDNPKFANIVWTPFTVRNKKYLQIGNELVMKTNLLSERMNEWDRLFPI